VSITLLYGCFHIELSVPDVHVASAFMQDVLGAALVEQDMVRDLRALVPDDYGIEHLDCGGATFQLNQPSPSMAERGIRSVHQGYLDRGGPCVTNLNFYVDDIVHARELLTRLGSEPRMQGSSVVIESLREYGPENTRPDGDKRPFFYMGAQDLIGFDLEMMEPNFSRVTEQTHQSPCFYGERPGTGVEGLRLNRLCIAVPDLAATYANIVEIFAPGSRSKPYAIRTGRFARALRITIGGLEMEYCQPLGSDTALARHLEHHGPGVVTADFGVPTVESVTDRLRGRESVEVVDAVDLVGEDAPGRRSQLLSRPLVGFDVVLEDVEEFAFATSS
jgi:catechol 2,3-dioxygenase-like lactoylglutathione lyase family enzyme